MYKYSTSFSFIHSSTVFFTFSLNNLEVTHVPTFFFSSFKIVWMYHNLWGALFTFLKLPGPTLRPTDSESWVIEPLRLYFLFFF